MATLPATGYLEDASRTHAEMKQAFEDQRDCIAQLPGGAAHASYDISGGDITPSVAVFGVDTEAAAASDDLEHILLTNFANGNVLILHCDDAARVVTVKDSASGAGQIFTADGEDVVLDDPYKCLVLRYDTAAWYEIGRFGFDNAGRVVVKTTAYQLKRADSGKTFTNEGATAEVVLTLPAAAAGLRYSLVVQDTDGIELVAGAGDTIRDGSSVSAAAGKIESAEQGAAIELLAINATEWIVLRKQRTWTVT